MAQASMPEAAIQHKRRSKGCFRRQSGVSIQETSVLSNGCSDEYLSFTLKANGVLPDGNSKFMLAGEVQDRQEVVLKRWDMQDATDLYRTQQTPTHNRVENNRALAS